MKSEKSGVTAAGPPRIRTVFRYAETTIVKSLYLW